MNIKLRRMSTAIAVVGCLACVATVALLNKVETALADPAGSTDDVSVALRGPSTLELISCIYPNVVTGQLKQDVSLTGFALDCGAAGPAVDGANGWDDIAKKSYELTDWDGQYGFQVEYFDKGTDAPVASLDAIVETKPYGEYYAIYTLTTPNGVATARREIVQNGMLLDMNGDGAYSTADTSVLYNLIPLVSAAMPTRGYMDLEQFSNVNTPGQVDMLARAFKRLNIYNTGDSYGKLLVDSSITTIPAWDSDGAVEFSPALYDISRDLLYGSGYPGVDSLMAMYTGYVQNHPSVEIRYVYKESGGETRYLGIDHREISEAAGTSITLDAQTFDGYIPKQATITIGNYSPYQTVTFEYVLVPEVPNTGVK